jgi:ABC-type phosphate transport system substrate-binding protein
VRRITTIRMMLMGTVLLVSVSVLPARVFGEVVMVVNSGVVEESIDDKDIERIYLGKKTSWPDHSSIVPVMLKAGPVHQEFVEEIVGRSEHRFASYWRQMVFTGKGVPPRSFDTEDEVVGFVKETPGAVGYVSPSTDVTGVTVLTQD